MKISVERFNIEVVLEHMNDSIAASISPMFYENGKLDATAYDEFISFVLNIEGLFYQNGYEVVEQHSSKNEGSVSEYFTVYRKSDETDTLIKKVFYIRVSDHELDKSRNKSRNSYYNEQTRKLSESLSKRIKGWKLFMITVNSEKFFDYEDALEYFEHSIQTWR